MSLNTCIIEVHRKHEGLNINVYFTNCKWKLFIVFKQKYRFQSVLQFYYMILFV